ncbi:isomerase/hydrolase [Hahella sp. CCB-MM4]|uniref:fumarylacetoacetate hydrolase family protein n=1 Tax=Hahella sp. (strain CCB-MM4) TaxID=1926491 RepID=UPI000B9BBA00|nr:fumarylacetoacetate hydrolase family protein [Hahella sp. CCB-MM4]OZG72273.1 isomerase/hydrolase [Hahella sp. CCB-MM4]
MMHARMASGEEFSSPVSKVVCVGRNYAEHARELNNPIPTTPILFIKPNSSLTRLEEGVSLLPGENVHYEAELAVLLGRRMKNADQAEARAAIVGLGIALDLTLREVQAKLKEKGLPWEVAKSFDGACPLSSFQSVSNPELENLEYRLLINGELRQHGVTSQMLNSVARLLAYASSIFTLEAGDVVLTGTPSGVGQLQSGDQLAFDSSFGISLNCEVR